MRPEPPLATGQPQACPASINISPIALVARGRSSGKREWAAFPASSALAFSSWNQARADVDGALAASVFHSGAIPIPELKRFLRERLGVDIRLLPFSSFQIDKRLNRFHYPTLYIFEVIKAISEEPPGTYNFLHDADCVWIDAAETLLNQIDSRKTLLYDIYQITDPELHNPHGLSRIDLGQFFKKIDPHYPVWAPVHFGGEIIGGTSEIFKALYKDLKISIEKCLSDPENLPTLPTGEGIFDGDEFLTSMTYNKIFAEYEPANRFIKRVWTSKKVNNVKKEDLDLVVWHAIAEKTLGLPRLYLEIVNENSSFWMQPTDELKYYLGSFLGIPERRPDMKEKDYLLHKVYFKLKNRLREIVRS